MAMFRIYTSLRFKSTDAKKKALGILFKKMNMDTKKLFGDLLETNNTRKKYCKIKVKSCPRDNGETNTNNRLLNSNIKPTPKGKVRYFPKPF